MKEVINVWKNSTPLQAFVFWEESEATGRNSSVSIKAVKSKTSRLLQNVLMFIAAYLI